MAGRASEDCLVPRLEALEPRLLLSADDFGGTFATAHAVALGWGGSAYQTGQVNSATDVDMFSFKGYAGATVTVTLTGYGTLRPDVTVYDQAQGIVAAKTNTGKLTVVAPTFSGIAGQTYYVQVSGHSSTVGWYVMAIKTASPPKVVTPVTPPPVTPPPVTPPPVTPPAPVTVPPAFLPGPDAYATGTNVAEQTLSTAAGMVLVITGTDAADTITVSQSAAGLVVTTAAGTQTFAGPFAGVAVYGFGGNDTLRLTSTVTVPSVVYGGEGADSLFAAGPGADYLFGQGGNDLLVTVGGGADYATGGDGTDSFWVDSTDTILDAEPAETAAGTVHRITAFFQPSTTAVPLEVAGQTIAGPASYYAYADFSAQPLFVDGPQYNDVAQGALSDCYFVAAASALAGVHPDLVRQIIAPLGDGTYAVRFYTSTGQETYVRVDARLPAYGGAPVYAHLSPTGETWVALVEKAYAQFHTTSNSYAALYGGQVDVTFHELTGKASAAWGTAALAKTTDLGAFMAGEIAAGHTLVASTPPSAHPRPRQPRLLHPGGGPRRPAGRGRSPSITPGATTPSYGTPTPTTASWSFRS